MTLAYAGLLEPKESALRLLKSMFDAENFACRLSGGEGSRSFKVIDVDKTKEPVTSACYDKQHICTYLQPFLHHLHLVVAL